MLGGMHAGGAAEQVVRRLRRREPQHPTAVAVMIATVCLLLTGIATWAASEVDANTEHRLLVVQTRQAGAVLTSAIPAVQQPLENVLGVQKVAGRTGDPEAFRQLMSSYVGDRSVYSSASLWQRRGSTLTMIASVGPPSALPATSPEAVRYVRRAFDSSAMTVRSLSADNRRWIGYARADPATGFAVYAERAIPADRRAPVDRDSAFAQLDYAIYLGPHATNSALSTTDVDPAKLPFRGNTSRISVPFGDTTLTLVTSPREHLGAALSQRLPLYLLLGGLVLTAGASAAGQQLAQERRTAEQNAATITDLYERVDAMYARQRDLSERLQLALLPQSNPTIPQLEVASQYVAGAQGVEIGGDWYSFVDLGEGRYGFVVGDVSGRGVDAVAVMARARFTIRAYLLDGHDPAATLEKCSRQFDIDEDDHLSTALVGVGDWRTGEVVVASAGHLSPLVLCGDRADFAETKPGWPLGTGPTTYESTTLTLSAGSTLFCFTDGLVERRDEDIDAGLERLAATAQGLHERGLADLVDTTVQRLHNPDAPDDVAVLAVRWLGAP